MTATDREPVRRSQLPPIPPPEWDHHTWYPTPDGGGDLVPGQHSRGILIRRRVTWGDWEPVHPGHWADEPAADEANRNAEDPTARFQRAASMLVDAIARAATASQDDFALVPSPDGDDLSNLTRLRARLVTDRDRATRNARHAHTEHVQLVNDGIEAGLDTAIRLLDTALDERDQEVEQLRSRLATLKRAHVALAEQAGRDQATLARTRAFVADMRDWCSPHGIAADYADRLLAVINEPEPRDQLTHRPQAGDPSPAGHGAVDPSGGGAL